VKSDVLMTPKETFLVRAWIAARGIFKDCCENRSTRVA
jgi:hypothetical protein